MNLLQMRQRCRSRFRDVAQNYYDDSEWNAYLNEAQADIMDASPFWPFLERSTQLTLIAGDRQFFFGTDLPSSASITYVYNMTTDSRLAPLNIPGSQFSGWPDPSITGDPAAYQLEHNTITVFPTPANAVILEVGYRTAATTEMSNDGDVPVVPERYHRMLIDGALARAYTDDGNLEQSQAHQARFDRLLAGMTFELLGGREDRYPTFVDTFWE